MLVGIGEFAGVRVRIEGFGGSGLGRRVGIGGVGGRRWIG